MITSINNDIYLRRRSKIVLPRPEGTEPLPQEYVATLLHNIETLGYTFSRPLFAVCETLSAEQFVDLHRELIPILQKARGAHREFHLMYPNFPAEVMETSRSQLYLNAILHYLTEGRHFPATARRERQPLLENTALTVIDLGNAEEFGELYGQIASSNTSLSEQDREDLAWFIASHGVEAARLLPDSIPQKENIAAIIALLVEHAGDGAKAIERYCHTATDLLRVAVALSKGDISLAEPARFGSLSRPERRMLLEHLERMSNPIEDMLRWKDRWIRLGERLHPGEFRNRFPRVAEAFDILRNDLPVTTFNSSVERGLATGEIGATVGLLRSRPGELARRLDHLLRIGANDRDRALEAFAETAPAVATPLLLQVREHFKRRADEINGEMRPIRVFFPKGSLARAQGAANDLPILPEAISARVVEICERALIDRFSALPPLGRCYLDPKLADYLVPFSQRSASRSLRTLVRGSKLPLPENAAVLRFFIWWKNGRDRTDIDLSAAMFDAEFNFKEVISFYNLTGYGGCHSGDIIDAPRGASEFIDITMEMVRQTGVRYVVMTLMSYTQQPYCELPECFAGWMARSEPKSGEVYEPRMVRDRIDITANTRVAIPLIIDLVQEEVIWCDMSLTNLPKWPNMVHENLGGIRMTLRAMTDLGKPNLYDLLALHITARGERVDRPELADTIFSVEEGTPFRVEEIAAGYLA